MKKLAGSIINSGDKKITIFYWGGGGQFIVELNVKSILGEILNNQFARLSRYNFIKLIQLSKLNVSQIKRWKKCKAHQGEMVQELLEQVLERVHFELFFLLSNESLSFKDFIKSFFKKPFTATAH